MGTDLAAARVRLGASIEDAAAALRIRGNYLRALEDGRPERLPGSAYALAFLRTYSKALGLDADDMVRRYKAENAALNRTPNLDFPQPASRGSVPLGAAVLVAAVLAVGAYAGWYRLSADGRLPAEVVPPVPAQLSEMAAPAMVAPKQAAAVQKVVPAPAERTALAQAPMAPALPATAPPPAPRVRDVAVLSVSPTQAAAAVPLSPPVPQPAAAPAPAASPPGMRVQAIADAWVQVRDADGNVVFSRLMHAGDSWPVPDRPGLVLTTGNAGGTEIVDDGVSTGPLGAKGVVRHGIKLDPAQMKASAADTVAPVALTQ